MTDVFDFWIRHGWVVLVCSMIVATACHVFLSLRQDWLRKKGLMGRSFRFWGGGFRDRMELLGLLIFARESETQDASFHIWLAIWRISYLMAFATFVLIVTHNTPFNI